ncbi:hypothetical protein L9F63_019795, partial [Diploptera punctata]
HFIGRPRDLRPRDGVSNLVELSFSDSEGNSYEISSSSESECKSDISDTANNSAPSWVVNKKLYPRCRTLKTSIMFSVYAEKRNLIESTKEFNWKNRRIGVILRDADVVVYGIICGTQA